MWAILTQVAASKQIQRTLQRSKIHHEYIMGWVFHMQASLCFWGKSKNIVVYTKVTVFSVGGAFAKI